MRPLDAAPLARITSEPLDHLRDADFLTNDLLPAMGLSTHAAPRLYPAHLHARVGRGVQSLQLPNQFGPYLATITQQGVRSYVEIGVDRGGTFAITVEVLRRFGLRHAVAVDLDPPAIFEQWGAPEVVFARMDSGSPAFADRVDAEAPIDLAFIDGDHSEEAVRRDFEVLRPHARMLAFHDITDHGCPGVGRVWRWIREKHAEKYEFREFTAQYPELPILPRMGIGLAIRR